MILAGGPQVLILAYIQHEVLKDAQALLGADHFGVKLHAAELLVFPRHRGDRATRGGGGDGLRHLATLSP